MVQSTFAHIQLVWLRDSSQLFRPLSNNIVREVLTYLPPSLCLPAIAGASVRLYDLDSTHVAVKALSRSLPAGIVFCLLGETSALCVGAHPPQALAYLVDLKTGNVTETMKMLCGRAWPGLVFFDDAAFVFGGNLLPSLRTCEKWQKGEWSQLPSMESGRVCFTPCVHGCEIYLADANSTSNYFEAFEPKTSSFRTILLTLWVPSFGSVAFEWDGNLTVLTTNNELAVLRHSELSVSAVSLIDANSACSSTPPMYAYGKVWWVNYWDAQLVEFSQSGLVERGKAKKRR